MNTLDYLREQKPPKGKSNLLDIDRSIDKILLVLRPCSERNSYCTWCNDVKECVRLYNRLC